MRTNVCAAVVAGGRTAIEALERQRSGLLIDAGEAERLADGLDRFPDRASPAGDAQAFGRRNRPFLKRRRSFDVPEASVDAAAGHDRPDFAARYRVHDAMLENLLRADVMRGWLAAQPRSDTAEVLVVQLVPKIGSTG
ncbi:MAG: hypothetical protein U0703_12170 [Anaerolineae bacterium]